MVVPINSSQPMFTPVDVEAVLASLSLPEKVSLLSGKDNWHTRDIPSKGVPSLRLSDGPNGCRGTKFFEGVPTSSFPCPTGMASTWDVDLLQKIGGALGDECRAKGVHVLLAPTVNMHRTPLNGRGFESFSEDPHLSGMLAGHLIRGTQAAGVGTALKHMVCNDQETSRYSVDVRVSERALREVYLKPFEIAIRLGQPWIVMMSYNSVNGTHTSENKWLITEILRNEWRFDGMTVSDWHGTYSIDEAVKAGLDLEMPGPALVRGGALLRAVNCGKVKVLGLVNRAAASGIPEGAPERENLYPATDVMRQSASDAIVLLKNTSNILPLKCSSKSIAVIGPNALRAEIFGGGSAALRASYAISPLEGISRACVGRTTIRAAKGCDSHKLTPLMGELCGNACGNAGFDVAFYNEPPSTGAKAVHRLTTTHANMFFNDNLPDHLNKACYARLTASFTPSESGTYEFGVGALGTADLYIDDELLIDNSTKPVPGDLFFRKGTREETGEIHLAAGTTYRIRVEYASPSASTGFVGPLAFNSRGGVRFGGHLKKPAAEHLREAVALAQMCEDVVVVLGLNHEYETEGYDRPNMKLPPTSIKLIEAILTVRPDAVICIQSGSPLELPFVESSSTLVQLFYNGNETGNGLADVLFGHVTPSGKLPFTMPRSLSECAAHASVKTFPGVDNKEEYVEGVMFGYRQEELSPLFPFGHGLSYSTFTYADVPVHHHQSAGNIHVRAEVRITNSGSTAGREIVQLYVAPPAESIDRPAKQLAAFAKTRSLAPGESEVIIMDVDREAFACWKDGWEVEGGEYALLVGASSADIRFRQALTLDTFRY